MLFFFYPLKCFQRNMHMSIHRRLYHRPLLTSQLLLQLSEIEKFMLTKVIIIQTDLRTTNVYLDIYINKQKKCNCIYTQAHFFSRCRKYWHHMFACTIIPFSVTNNVNYVYLVLMTYLFFLRSTSSKEYCVVYIYSNLHLLSCYIWV